MCMGRRHWHGPSCHDNRNRNGRMGGGGYVGYPVSIGYGGGGWEAMERGGWGGGGMGMVPGVMTTGIGMGG